MGISGGLAVVCDGWHCVVAASMAWDYVALAGTIAWDD